MRIAVSGSHATGKSTLVRELANRLGGFTAIEEPYYELADEGHALGDPPTLDDFEAMFARSVAVMTRPQRGNLLFDRCPADYLAYLSALSPEAARRNQLTDAAAALATLDLVVFVPIERPDRFDVREAPRLRRRVDRILREMLVEGEWGIDVPTLEVSGSPAERARSRFRPLSGSVVKTARGSRWSAA